MTDDRELLRRYAASGSEEAFAELVRRHLGLVYNSALRQVGGDRHRAEDVAQAVFTDLARKASRVSGHPVLAGWLYRSTRYAAASAVRAESRRQRREQVGYLMSGTDRSPGGDIAWGQLRPALDRALHGLGVRDRAAILLRFFEGLPFAEVGRQLNLTEAAARMRVERALEKLRRALGRRGAISSAGALAVLLAEQASAAVPPGLADGVTASALTAGATGTGLAGGILAMMSTTKTIAAISAAVAILAAGAAFYEARQASRATASVAGLAAENAGLRAAISPLRQGQAAAVRAASASDQAGLGKFAADFEEVQAWLKQHPEQQTLEMKYLTRRDWLEVMLRHYGADSEDDMRRALSDLRATGASNFARIIRYALVAYLQAHPDEPLEDLGQLKPYFDPPVDDALLARWEVMTDEQRKSLPKGAKLWVKQKPSSLVDATYDGDVRVGPLLKVMGGSMTYQSLSDESAEAEARELYAAATGGQAPSRPQQLIPFFTDPAMAKRYLAAHAPSL